MLVKLITDLFTPELYETYIKLIKHSQMGNTTKTEKERLDFQEKFIKRSIFNTSLVAEEPLYLTDQIDMIPFCERESFFHLLNISRKRQVNCDYFDPIITANGYCFTFNSLTMKDIFKPSSIVADWSNFLDLSETSNMFQPTGVNLINILQAVFLCIKVFCTSFLLFSPSVYLFFGGKKLSKKLLLK